MQKEIINKFSPNQKNVGSATLLTLLIILFCDILLYDITPFAWFGNNGILIFNWVLLFWLSSFISDKLLERTTNKCNELALDNAIESSPANLRKYLNFCKIIYGITLIIFFIIFFKVNSFFLLSLISLMPFIITRIYAIFTSLPLLDRTIYNKISENLNYSDPFFKKLNNDPTLIRCHYPWHPHNIHRHDRWKMKK